jgi:hypothetical protein
MRRGGGEGEKLNTAAPFLFLKPFRAISTGRRLVQVGAYSTYMGMHQITKVKPGDGRIALTQRRGCFVEQGPGERRIALDPFDDGVSIVACECHLYHLFS